VPVHVNVVPGDAAAGRIPDPVVTSEKAFQQAQRAKRAAAEALRSGDHGLAGRLYEQAGMDISAAAMCAPAPMAADFAEEAALLSDLAQRVDHDDPRRLAKQTEVDWHRKMRRRGSK
jgi:Ca-activated chloride channel family protein